MDGTIPTKLLRILKHGVFQPASVPQYLRTLPYWNRSPLELQLPWISWGAIQFLDSYLSESQRVFEWGGGGSTLFFAKRCASVHTIESSKAWLDRINDSLAKQPKANVSLELLTIDVHSQERFRDSSYAQALGENTYDVIFIDGYEESVELRPICFEYAESAISPGGIIVLDDAWRYPQIRDNNSAKSYRTFTSLGPCRYGVTSTEIYFY